MLMFHSRIRRNFIVVLVEKKSFNSKRTSEHIKNIQFGSLKAVSTCS